MDAVESTLVVDDQRRPAACLRLIALLLLMFVIVVCCSSGCRRTAPPSDDSKASSSTPSPSKTEASTDPARRTPSDAVVTPAKVLEAPAAKTPVDGKELFAQHCAACHGERGDGQGIAAAFLFPKPRDLRAGRFRLVSTDNAVPTREDLHAVLMRGMPGSAMPPWVHLSQAERDALVDEVLRIRADGARDSFITILKEDDGLSDEEIEAEDIQAEIHDYVDEATTPGQSTAVPELGAPTTESLARGKEAYTKFACVQCHGETGRGDGAAPMVDDEGMPARPRDFTLGIFKGNHDPASLYRRIAYGMPGSPMPSSSTMAPEQMVDLVHYIRSLSSEEQREASIPKRTRIVVKRVKAIPENGDDDVWEQAAPVSLHMTPLWWRNDADVDFTVQAVHDGNSIAVRMSWKDAVSDVHSLRSEAFEDAVALEFYRGPAEPFLGMGDAKSPVDVWFWDADRQSGPDDADAEYPNTVVDIFPFSEAVASGAEINRPGAQMADQPDVSLPARAVGNPITPIADDESGGTSLHATGPRTVTFRVLQSQIVRAKGVWSDGRWTVVMTRVLSPPSADDGLPLVPGEAASIAFAVWEGSHRDRNGQKSVTIWQDLYLEK